MELARNYLRAKSFSNMETARARLLCEQYRYAGWLDPFITITAAGEGCTNYASDEARRVAKGSQHIRKK